MVLHDPYPFPGLVTQTQYFISLKHVFYRLILRVPMEVRKL